MLIKPLFEVTPMDAASKREIVIEIEQIRLIRKRARTQIVFCGKCGKGSDFVSLNDAAELFMTDAQRIFNFITHNACQFYEEKNGDVYICLVEILETMRDKTGTSGTKLLGDNSK
jgi:hypothetical protein